MTRSGIIIGKLSDLCGNTAAYCRLHHCRAIVNERTDEVVLARWLALGKPVPLGASDAARAAARKEHMSLRPPNAPRR